jgi:hypothetical protein
MYLMETGSHPQVWEDFDPKAGPAAARAAGYRGSDQAWISYTLAGKVPIWGDDEGIYSVRDVKPKGAHPPPWARLIHFNGDTKPWSPAAGRWVARSWY